MRMRAGFALPALLVSLPLLAGCRGEAPPAGPPLTVREIPTPAAPGSGEPNLAVASDGKLVLSWIEPAGEGAHALRFASRAEGGSWSAPRTAAQGPDWFVNWADFPTIAALPDGSLFASWLSRSGAGKYAYDVRVAASRDGGGKWGPSLVPHRDGTQTEHGFVSFVPWDAARMGVVWLDGRETASGGPTAAMTLRFASVDAAGALSDEAVLDSRVCDCCQTAAARAEGAVIVAYRDRTEGEVRDVSVVRFADGRWSAPVGVGADNWVIDGCPVNGPALAASGRQAVLAWFSSPGDKARVRASFSSDSGASWGAPIAVDDGRPLGRVDVVLLAGGDALVTWLERTPQGAEVRLRRLAPDGRRHPSVLVAGSSEARSSGFPRMERTGGEVLVAWRDPAEPARIRAGVVDVR
jgi:hypothetical protein